MSKIERACLFVVAALWLAVNTLDHQDAVKMEAIRAERDAQVRATSARARCEERDFLLHRDVVSTVLTAADGEGWKLFCGYRWVTPVAKAPRKVGA